MTFLLLLIAFIFYREIWKGFLISIGFLILFIQWTVQLPKRITAKILSKFVSASRASRHQ